MEPMLYEFAAVAKSSTDNVGVTSYGYYRGGNDYGYYQPRRYYRPRYVRYYQPRYYAPPPFFQIGFAFGGNRNCGW